LENLNNRIRSESLGLAYEWMIFNMYLRGVSCDSIYWINMTQDRDKIITLVIAVINFSFDNFCTRKGTSGFLRNSLLYGSSYL